MTRSQEDGGTNGDRNSLESGACPMRRQQAHRTLDKRGHLPFICPSVFLHDPPAGSWTPMILAIAPVYRIPHPLPLSALLQVWCVLLIGVTFLHWVLTVSVASRGAFALYSSFSVMFLFHLMLPL